MEDISNIQLFFALIVLSIGSVLGNVVIAKYIYLPWVKKLKDNEEKEIKTPYEELIPFKDVYDCDIDLDSISKERYITSETPEGYVFMRYNLDEEGFEYWCNNKNIKFKYLETVARKYISTYLCKGIYKDRNVEEESEKEEDKPEKEEEEVEDVFVKPKKSTIKNNNKRIVSNVVSNKYIYKGDVNDLTIFKQNIEKEDDKKKKLSFSDYKRLLLSSS
tara:strand:+ start:1095 stop:1748 length:654 start_codon:yes stop_codon:yes gene_type:complete